MSTSGMSENTSRAYKVPTGVEGSRKAAEHDFAKYCKYETKFKAAEKESGVPAPLLGAIASRESRIGSALPASGYGGDGHGYGIMQVDDRHHSVDKSGGPYSQQNINQGAHILKDSIREVQRKHPSWTKEQQLQGGVAAYNFGVKNVRTVDGIDRGTTGNDYSSDTIARAEYFEERRCK